MRVICRCHCQYKLYLLYSRAFRILPNLWLRCSTCITPAINWQIVSIKTLCHRLASYEFCSFFLSLICGHIYQQLICLVHVVYTFIFLRTLIPFNFSMELYEIHSSSSVSPTASCQRNQAIFVLITVQNQHKPQYYNAWHCGTLLGQR